jgi:hypothetical protein
MEAAVLAGGPAQRRHARPTACLRGAPCVLVQEEYVESEGGSDDEGDGNEEEDDEPRKPGNSGKAAAGKAEKPKPKARRGVVMSDEDED